MQEKELATGELRSGAIGHHSFTLKRWVTAKGTWPFVALKMLPLTPNTPPLRKGPRSEAALGGLSHERFWVRGHGHLDVESGQEVRVARCQVQRTRRVGKQRHVSI